MENFILTTEKSQIWIMIQCFKKKIWLFFWVLLLDDNFILPKININKRKKWKKSIQGKKPQVIFIFIINLFNLRKDTKNDKINNFVKKLKIWKIKFLRNTKKS